MPDGVGSIEAALFRKSNFWVTIAQIKRGRPRARTNTGIIAEPLFVFSFTVLIHNRIVSHLLSMTI